MRIQRDIGVVSPMRTSNACVSNIRVMDLNKTRLPALMLLCAALLGLSACSSTPKEPLVIGDIEVNDPFEGFNRGVFAFNNVVDDVVIHPTVKGYRAVVPKPARKGVRNVLRNLKSPVTLANELLQGDFDGAHNVFVRAAVNTFVGVAGIFDVAGHEGYEYEAEDFGQTMAVWGVGHGPYIVLPLLGGASFRDASGFAIESFADPLRHYFDNIDKKDRYYVKAGVDYLNLRDSLMDVYEDLGQNSFDYYAAVRSTYYQNREALVRENDLSSTAAYFDEFDDDGDEW